MVTDTSNESIYTIDEAHCYQDYYYQMPMGCFQLFNSFGWHTYVSVSWVSISSGNDVFGIKFCFGTIQLSLAYLTIVSSMNILLQPHMCTFFPDVTVPEWWINNQCTKTRDEVNISVQWWNVTVTNAIFLHYSTGVFSLILLITEDMD